MSVDAYTKFGKQVTATPQSQPIPGREVEMVANNAGGFGFILDKWERLNRFLVLGSEGGTYYVGEQKLTAENATNVIACIKTDGVRVITQAHQINIENRAPKVDQQLFVMALALQHGDATTKMMVEHNIQSMLRTGTHLLHFVAMIDNMGGWNRQKRRIVASWFTSRPVDQVAFQVLKYQNRDGWRMRDVLRVSHPRVADPELARVFDWICERTKLNGDFSELPGVLFEYCAMQHAIKEGASQVTAAVMAIQHGVPREALPTAALAFPETWKALLIKGMPLHQRLRNLGNMTAKQLFDTNVLLPFVTSALTNPEHLRKARVHPFAIMLANLTYRCGQGFKGNLRWYPVKAIIEALDDAYELAFATVTPTGKRICIAVDVSGSMTAGSQGTFVSCGTAAAAMALTLARLEPNARVVRFAVQVEDEIHITKRSALLDIASCDGGGTNLAAPIEWASRNNIAFDAFVILTDNETWAGNSHATEALRAYRKQMGMRTKLVCCSFAANHANIVDPTDPQQMGCAGLDANIPSLVADFIGY